MTTNRWLILIAIIGALIMAIGILIGTGGLLGIILILTGFQAIWLALVFYWGDTF